MSRRWVGATSATSMKHLSHCTSARRPVRPSVRRITKSRGGKSRRSYRRAAIKSSPGKLARPVSPSGIFQLWIRARRRRGRWTREINRANARFERATALSLCHLAEKDVRDASARFSNKRAPTLLARELSRRSPRVYEHSGSSRELLPSTGIYRNSTSRAVKGAAAMA